MDRSAGAYRKVSSESVRQTWKRRAVRREAKRVPPSRRRRRKSDLANRIKSNEQQRILQWRVRIRPFGPDSRGRFSGAAKNRHAPRTEEPRPGHRAGRDSALLHHPPLRTVRETFASYGSSLYKAPFDRSRQRTYFSAMDLPVAVWVQKHQV